MNPVAGVDGAPEGWAIVIMAGGQSIVRKVAALSQIFDDGTDFDIVAVDTPIGLLDAYAVGGRVWLVMLKDAGACLTKLPKAEHEAPERQAAMQALILVATRGGRQ